MSRQYEIGDGWWNDHIMNTSQVTSITRFNQPHWECKVCGYNDADILDVRFHIQRDHKDMQDLPGTMVI